jgi:tripartite ATP-independent transporter DctP family solute receptor
MKGKLLIFLLAAILMASLNFAVAADAPQKFKFAHLGRPDPFVEAGHAAIMNFKYIMEKRSGGQFQVDIYPAGTLGKEIESLEATKSNVVQLFSASGAALHRVFPPAIVTAIPYIFKNEAIAHEVVDGPFGEKILDAFTAKTGIKAFAVMDMGFTAITNSVRPIRKPEDFKGIKFRGMDTLQVTMFESFGASAVPISWPEVYTSLQTGVVKGQTNPPHIIAGFKINEVQKYMTLANVQFGGQLWICNKGVYDALSSDGKKILRDAARLGTLTSRSLGTLLDNKAVTDVKAKGMEVTGLSSAEIAEFQKIATPACIKWMKTQMEPQWIDDLLKAIEDAEKKLGYR